MNRGKIPVAEYRQYARQFNPVKYNAEEWVRLAKAAGMKYIVITSKHHDGFAMFDSQASDWTITKASPFGRDPLKELAAACRKHGLKLGFYYSQAQDWVNGGSAAGESGIRPRNATWMITSPRLQCLRCGRFSAITGPWGCCGGTHRWT
jgi:alpha-L-fucosidase